ncbi:phosphodiesterase [Ralstonia pseudosolanacearum]
MHFLQLTDLHIKQPGRLAYRRVDTAAYLSRCVAHILAQPARPDAIVLTGDLVDAGAPEEYAHLRALLAPLDAAGIRMLPVLGNHDARDAAREAFADWLAPIPAEARDPQAFQYWTDIGEVRLIVLDTLDTGFPGGRLGVPRLDWLHDALAAETARPVVIAMHHPPFATGIGHMDVQSLAAEDIAAFAQIVRAAGNVERILCGHLHRAIDVRFAGTVASTCPSPAHQVALDLDPEGAPGFVMEPPAYRVHAWVPGQGLVSHLAYVGAFDGPHPFFEPDGRLID